jgi:hypothetical protein
VLCHAELVEAPSSRIAACRATATIGRNVCPAVLQCRRRTV